MQTIDVKYVDTTKYKVTISSDVFADNPCDWGNYTIVQFKDNDFNSYRSIDEYCNENGKLLPSVQAKIRAGKIFTFTYNRYSSCDGGYYRYPSNETDVDNIDGFIIFDDAYIKGISYEERKRYAKQDLDTYTQWVNGEVYSILVEDEHGKYIDSCSGYIGDVDVQHGVIDMLPDALPENVEIIDWYENGQTYDTYFDYNDCLKTVRSK